MSSPEKAPPEQLIQPPGASSPIDLPSGNDRVRFQQVTLLSDNWFTLHRIDFDYRTDAGNWEHRHREAYDRGNGATILLHDPDRRTVLLTRQFRLPAYLNDHPTGALIETPAGLLDADDPLTAIVRECEEETGVRPRNVRPLFDLYMSPGSVTERVMFFSGEYSEADCVSAGGGLPDEGEDIEVVEIPLRDAVAMTESGEIRDGKTVLLLLWAGQHLVQKMSSETV